jgi:hypothetical protein
MHGVFYGKKTRGHNFTKKGSEKLKPNNVLSLKFNGGFNGAMTQKK